MEVIKIVFGHYEYGKELDWLRKEIRDFVLRYSQVLW